MFETEIESVMGSVTSGFEMVFRSSTKTVYEGCVPVSLNI
jgi:hypothetical protein